MPQPFARFVHMPVAKRDTKVVKSELRSVLDLHSGHYRGWHKMVTAEWGRG